MMKKNRVDVITMGCSKNLVDSEHLMRQLQECGYEVTHDCEEPCGEIAVINTCGFIGDAKQESINMILGKAAHDVELFQITLFLALAELENHVY